MNTFLFLLKRCLCVSSTIRCTDLPSKNQWKYLLVEYVMCLPPLNPPQATSPEERHSEESHASRKHVSNKF